MIVGGKLHRQGGQNIRPGKIHKYDRKRPIAADRDHLADQPIPNLVPTATIESFPETKEALPLDSSGIP